MWKALGRIVTFTSVLVIGRRCQAGIFAELLRRAHWRYDPVDTASTTPVVPPKALKTMNRLFGADISGFRMTSVTPHDLILRLNGNEPVSVEVPECYDDCESCIRRLAHIARDIAETRDGR